MQEMTAFDFVFCFFWMVSIFALAGVFMVGALIVCRVLDAIEDFVTQFLAGCGGL